MLRLKDGFYAKDEDGAIFMYDKFPVQKSSEWVDETYEQVDNISIDEDWQDSLYEVKDGISTKVIIYEKDQKVLVRNHELQNWKRRYYSHYENGRHRVFMDGTTSWSKTNTVSFNQIKPYIEGQDRRPR